MSQKRPPNDARRAANAQAAQARAAEAQREAERRSRRRRLLMIGAAGIGVVVVAALIGVVLANQRTVPAPTASAAVPTAALQRTSAPPWNAPSDVEAGVTAAGLTMLSAEGSALHIHQHLSVTVDGAPVTVPADIGIDVAAQQISSIHTHDDSGIIHVESPTVRRFTLGQVFDEWQVALGSGRVGGYVDQDDGQTITVFVNGAIYGADPHGIALTEHEDIDIVVAKAGTAVAAPAAFRWPAGY